MKRLLIALGVLIGLFFSTLFFGFFVWAETAGKYKWEIEACFVAREANQARSITDYICSDDAKLSKQDVAYQVVFSLEMNKLDKEVKEELVSFQKEKSKDVVGMQKKISSWFDATADDPKYVPKYKNLCKDINSPGNPMGEVIAAYSSDATSSGDNGLSVTTDSEGAGSFIQGEGTCSAFVDRKLAAYREVARIVAVDNTVSSFTEDKSKFTGKLKEQYNKFIMEWTIYIGDLARIKDKWPSKTKITQ